MIEKKINIINFNFNNKNFNNKYKRIEKNLFNIFILKKNDYFNNNFIYFLNINLNDYNIFDIINKKIINLIIINFVLNEILIIINFINLYFRVVINFN